MRRPKFEHSTPKAESPGRQARPALPQRGPYSRGYLPHIDYQGAIQCVTYRLADSLPAHAIEQMLRALDSVPFDLRSIEGRHRTDRMLDRGLGSCVLRDPRAARCVIDNWKWFDGIRYTLIAWVVMPNHVHVLIEVFGTTSLGSIVQSWKSYTGRVIGQLLAGDDIAAPRNRGGVWMREYWDRLIRDDAHLAAAINYIHSNPVRAKLVGTAHDWPWSSASTWVGGDGRGK